MTASERARLLIDELIAAAHDDGVLVANGFLSRVKALDRRRASEAALLAYVAALEAVADQARMELRRYPDDPALHSIRSALSVAALDRPEDGETK